MRGQCQMANASVETQIKYCSIDTQFKNFTEQVCDVVIGFDFGTSSTKVILQTPNFFSKWCEAIPFNPTEHGVGKYLLPSKLYFSRKHGRTSLSKFDSAEIFSNIKIIYLSRARNKEALSEFTDEGIRITTNEFVVAYLANVLQRARIWFITEKSNMFGQFKLAWHLNLGIPSGKYNADSITDFLQLAQAAWDLSVEKETINLKDAFRLLKITTHEKIKASTGTGNIHIFPEITAEMIGYTKSRKRTDGLHLIIDIGASTLDVAAFHLTKKDEIDHHVQLKTSISLLGSFMLHEQRLKAVWRHTREHLASKYRRINIMDPLPDQMNLYWPNGKLPGDSDLDFYKKCRSAIYSIIIDLKDNKDPFSQAWERGLPCFLCGGGRNIPFYQMVINDIHQDFIGHCNCAGLQSQEIPEPDNLRIVDYYRFAVAYGLSFFEHEIGSIKPSSQIKNIERKINSKYLDASYIGKDQV